MGFTPNPLIHAHRRYSDKEAIDHVFISFLECRFRGFWNLRSSQISYVSSGEESAVNLVEMNGTRKTINFKKGAYVTILPPNVITYERQDEEESVYVDEDERNGKPKNNTVI